MSAFPFRLFAALALPILSFACVTDDEDSVDGDRADTLDEYRVELEVTEVLYLEPGDASSSGMIETTIIEGVGDKPRLLVRAPAFVLPDHESSLLRFPDTRRWGFFLGHRAKGELWSFEILRRGDALAGNAGSVDAFRASAISLELGQISQLVGSTEVGGEPLPQGAEIAVIPVVLEDWWDIEGDYEFQLNKLGISTDLFETLAVYEQIYDAPGIIGGASDARAAVISGRTAEDAIAVYNAVYNAEGFGIGGANDARAAVLSGRSAEDAIAVHRAVYNAEGLGIGGVDDARAAVLSGRSAEEPPPPPPLVRQ
jgi:hypothetical protein